MDFCRWDSFGIFILKYFQQYPIIQNKWKYAIKNQSFDNVENNKG